ncbi:hypothetical protein PMAYCL1PPCAC_11418 [Pristionchus mayeri]|uniref:Uncharacterized protein n=1 Tax=Pristionchus mayeri TaxID=1317129 RepID=A0AAN5C875_9BILA|nr:hypothetical protein PMAYCL1PPCAC_11418 [Pristionchus mayeri]
MVKEEDDDGSYTLPHPPNVVFSVKTEESTAPHISTASIYIAAMSRLESTTSVKQWESERKREVEGTPPRPEDNPSTIEGEARRATIRGITPSYKTGDGKANYDLTLGQSGHLPNAAGDYKMKQSMESYRQTIIDPLVRSNATMPTPLIPNPHIPAGDFASEHSRRLFKSDPLETKTFQATKSKPIVISDYLTKSIDRHRDMEASRLRDLLKAKESDANQPWNKPGWPGPKPNDDEKMRELEHMKKSIERLEREASKPKKNGELDENGRRREELLERSRRNRDSYTATDSKLIKEGPEPVPAYFKEHVREMLESRASIDTAKTKEDDAKSGYVTEPSKSIMKRRELESREDMMGAGREVAVHRDYQRSHSSMSAKPRVTQTVQRFEEHKRTEEVERRVQRKERRERRTRHEWSESGRHQGGGHRSNSMSRNYAIGYHPTQETQWRSESMRRGQNGFHEGGLAHARYGSLSDSLRRGELKYVPNGEVRESFYSQNGGGQRMHKSYSTRDVFNRGGYEDDRSSWRRGGPVIEYPPTLPRHGDSRSEYRPVSKSRSYADWDDRERGRRRGEDEMSRLEHEFRDASLLVPASNMGGGPVNHREHRTEQIPGGYETYHKEMKGDQGRRMGRDGRPVDFSEQSTEYSFKREVDGRDGRH